MSDTSVNIGALHGVDILVPPRLPVIDKLMSPDLPCGLVPYLAHLYGFEGERV